LNVWADTPPKRRD